MAKGDNPIFKLFVMKSQSQCQDEGTHYHVPKGAGGHMVFVLTTPNKDNAVKVVTVTTKDTIPNIQFYPLAPLSKGSYGSRLEIKHYNNQYYRSALPKYSYVRLEPFYIPYEILVPMVSKRVWFDNSIIEEQLALKVDSGRKLRQRIQAIENQAMETRKVETIKEVEKELAARRLNYPRRRRI
ncbi:hypothetical protein EG327_010730 [Venturia inaequalis]|uniref:Uncharacterized protein n=2 Tax=Venturia inaequalis TaxID=5025 RepID=A0A8H3ZD54_VENIN|nr:hypothetical protein EG327_010730 [Venturia inaequalis]